MILKQATKFRIWKELQYLVVTRETAFELTFLEKFEVELLIGHM